MRLERLGTTDPNEKVLGLLASKTYLLITSNHANSKREHFFTGGFSFLLKNFCHFFAETFPSLLSRDILVNCLTVVLKLNSVFNLYFQTF